MRSTSKLTCRSDLSRPAANHNEVWVVASCSYIAGIAHNDA